MAFLNRREFVSGSSILQHLVMPGETPSGAVDGVNTVFTTAFTILSGAADVFVNGQLQTPTTDYDISGGNTITFHLNGVAGATISPGSVILVEYIK